MQSPHPIYLSVYDRAAIEGHDLSAMCRKPMSLVVLHVGGVNPGNQDVHSPSQQFFLKLTDPSDVTRGLSGRTGIPNSRIAGNDGFAAPR
jgi:hypothetical protein